jgi:hypothetical protein
MLSPGVIMNATQAGDSSQEETMMMVCKTNGTRKNHGLASVNMELGCTDLRTCQLSLRVRTYLILWVLGHVFHIRP